MHSTSIPVKRDHRRAKTDRLDCQLMMRAFPGWLRREEGHCRMVAVPTAEQEDARRVTRERKGLVRETDEADQQAEGDVCLSWDSEFQAASEEGS